MTIDERVIEVLTTILIEDEQLCKLAREYLAEQFAQEIADMNSRERYELAMSGCPKIETYTAAECAEELATGAEFETDNADNEAAAIIELVSNTKDEE